MTTFLIIDSRDGTVVGKPYPNETMANKRAERYNVACGEMVHVVQGVTNFRGCSKATK